MTLPWYPRDMGKYARDTKDLSLLEHGAYNLLLDYYYSKGRIEGGSNAGSNATSMLPLMPDHSRPFRICSAITRDEQTAVEQVLRKFFRYEGGFFIHDKCEEVIEKQSEKHKKRVEAGKKGGESNARSNAGSNTPQKETENKTKKEEKESLKPQTPLKPPLPPASVDNSEGQESGDFKPAVSGREGGAAARSVQNFDIERLISDNVRERAKMMLRVMNRDFYAHVQIYNERITSGNYPPPDKPDAAFLAWIPAYTKGKKL